MQEFKLNCTGEESGLRIDRYLADHLDGQSRNSIQKLIEEGHVLVNGNTCRASYKLQENDQIFVSVPDAVLTELRPERIPLDILYEDDQLLIVNKPKEMVVHPAPGHNTGTLVNAIMYHCGKELSGINGEIRPGIVHRIDMNTPGSLIVCKTDAAHRFIASQIKEHSVHRVYRAIVYGHLNPTEGTIRTSIGRDPRDRKKMSVGVKNGRQAITHYCELARLKSNFSYVEFELETGPTHQIRVHDDRICTSDKQKIRGIHSSPAGIFSTSPGDPGRRMTGLKEEDRSEKKMADVSEDSCHQLKMAGISEDGCHQLKMTGISRR